MASLSYSTWWVLRYIHASVGSGRCAVTGPSACSRASGPLAQAVLRPGPADGAGAVRRNRRLVLPRRDRTGPGRGGRRRHPSRQLGPRWRRRLPFAGRLWKPSQALSARQRGRTFLARALGSTNRALDGLGPGPGPAAPAAGTNGVPALLVIYIRDNTGNCDITFWPADLGRRQPRLNARRAGQRSRGPRPGPPGW